jgi:DNA-binding transcriptional MerR regulator
MHYVLRREDYLGRQKMSLEDALSELRFKPDTEFLVDSEDFIELMHEFYGFTITRRNLQLYSSPFFKYLLPPPIHIGGHKSYYLNPEHTQRLAVILHLNTKQFMPLKAIRELLRHFPERHYGIILKDILTIKELKQIAEHFGEGFEIKDYLFYKVSRVLRALDESGEPEGLQDENARDMILLTKAHEYDSWLSSERRGRIETFLHEEEKKG